MLAEQIDCGQSLERGHVAGAGHHDVGLSVLISAGPRPDSNSIGAVLDGSFHVEPLQSRLFARHDHVDVIPAAQAVIGHRKKRVGVGRQIDANDVRFLVHHKINEPGVLVTESVVVLPPDV